MPDDKSNSSKEAVMRRLGQVVDGKYRLLSVIGIGGMGVVYEAEHQFLGRRVALKILHPRYVDRLQELQRFLREARSVGAMGHRFIVEAFDAGFVDGTTPYLVMERLVGENLEQYIERKTTLSAKRTFRFAYEILTGLSVAHAKNVLHCDMKPANVFIVRSQGVRTGLKLLDFGFSKLAVRGRANSVDEPTGYVFGTPFYMAPEQVVGDAVDQRTDLYAVGVIVYESLMGKPPFWGFSRRDVFNKILRSCPDPLHPPRGPLPSELAELVMQMLAKDPADRPPTAVAVTQRLIELGAVRASVHALAEDKRGGSVNE